MALPTQTQANKAGFSVAGKADTDSLIHHDLGGIRLYVGTGSPDGEVTAPKGSMFIELSGPDLYMNTDASTTWELVGGQT